MMQINTPYTLDFLIYLQNIYLNQKERGEHFKFPYLAENVMFSNDFQSNLVRRYNDENSTTQAFFL